MAALVGFEGSSKGKRIELDGTVIIGRANDADVRLDDMSVSRRHARLTCEASGATIDDLGSGNGTFVNDQRIQQSTELRDGDIIRFSDSFVFQFVGEKEKSESRVDLVDQPAHEQPAVMQTINVKATLMDIPAAHVDPDDLARAHERFRMVLEISNAVRAQLDLDRLLNDIVEKLFQVFGQSDRCFVLLKSDETQELKARVARTRGRDEPERIMASRSIIDKAIEGRLAILSADTMSDQRFSAAMSVMNLRIRSMMCAPIIASEDVLGVICLDTLRQDKRFTLDDLELLTGVANQTAFAIANAKMHQRLLRQQRMERDLQLARQVQRSFLPGEPPKMAGLEFCATYHAALEVGGDFYDFIDTGDGKLGIIVGDVAGKGIPAALLMARTTSDVRSLAMQRVPPPQLVGRLNERLNATGNEGAFITLIYGVLDAKARSFAMVNAAHPPPLVRAGATGAVREVQSCTNFPIGAVEENEFEPEQFSLAPGDVVCLFTDGITEAMNAQKELFGIERVRESLARPASGPRAVMENLLADIRRFVGETQQSDDLTVVCFGALE